MIPSNENFQYFFLHPHPHYDRSKKKKKSTFLHVLKFKPRSSKRQIVDLFLLFLNVSNLCDIPIQGVPKSLKHTLIIFEFTCGDL